MKKKLISFFKNNPRTAFRAKDIAKKLNIYDDNEYAALKSFIHQLYEEEFLTKNGKRFKYNALPTSASITGELQVNEGGFGFVILKNSKMGDIFVAERNLGTAFHGDTVEVSLFAKQKGRNIEGQITRIVKRKRTEIIGVLKKSKSFFFVKPDEPQVHRDIYISSDSLKGAKSGDKVIAGNISWDNPMLNPEGEVIEILGKSGSHDTEIISLAREFNLPYKFSPETLNEAESINGQMSSEEIESRIDFRDKSVFTIDPVDAKDFDDALSIEKIEKGNFRIGIHIADVSHYVAEKSNLDKEALKRGNSVYFVGKVIPMLPEKLSNNICSLVPGEDRLTYSVIVDMTPRGKVENYQIKKTIINSKRRFAYEEVQAILDQGSGDFYNEIKQLNTLAKTLRQKRLREGSIDFYTTEVKFELNEEGKPISIAKKEVMDSNRLIEEFMLLANRIVAKHIAAPESGSVKPFVYRIHDLPDPEKIMEFAKFVKSLGYTFDPHAASKQNQFQKLIIAARETEEEAVINELAIRSMAKAIYSTNNIGHYGLGFRHYSHFTSPIRRYADLLVHRMLFKYLDDGRKVSYNIDTLEEICDHISQTERSAVEAERLSVKLKQIEYMTDHIGEEFHAVISGIMHFGIFVKITEVLAEGLIKVKDLEGDFFVYDEKKYSLIGRSTKKQYRLGDKLTVKLIRADQERSELDFVIAE
jgi:ribonuclease R